MAGMTVCQERAFATSNLSLSGMGVSAQTGQQRAIITPQQETSLFMVRSRPDILDPLDLSRSQGNAARRCRGRGTAGGGQKPGCYRDWLGSFRSCGAAKRRTVASMLAELVAPRTWINPKWVNPPHTLLRRRIWKRAFFTLNYLIEVRFSSVPSMKVEPRSRSRLRRRSDERYWLAF